MTTLLCRCFAYMPRMLPQKSSAVHDRTHSVTPPVFSVTTAVSGGVRLYLLDGRGGEMVSVRTVLRVVLNFAFLSQTSLRRGARACRIVVPHHKRAAINLTALPGPLTSMEEGEEEEEAEAVAEKAADEAVENRVDTPGYTPTPSLGHNETRVESNSSPLHRKDLEGAKALVAFSAGKAVLTTKFGNISIGSEDEIEAQSEIRIAAGTE
uniref:Uncharacterized protein n=1 Tax=Oryza rufipogon TaxID=4529 RepID=A0A0E0P5N3_ORYRU